MNIFEKIKNIFFKIFRKQESTVKTEEPITEIVIEDPV